jgi:hypothetical protein
LNLQIAEAVSFLSSSSASSNRIAANWPCPNGKPRGYEKEVIGTTAGRYTSALSCPKQLVMIESDFSVGGRPVLIKARHDKDNRAVAGPR